MTTTHPAPQLALIALSEKATPGEWEAIGDCARTSLHMADQTGGDLLVTASPWMEGENIQFICALVNHFRATQSRPEAELPELPEPSIKQNAALVGNVYEFTPYFTAEQMRAYGQQCAATRPAEVGGDGDRADAERYRHLRAGKRHSMQAPFVQNPKKSVLYAVQSYTGEDLDAAVDEDILDVLAHRLDMEGELVESGYTGEPWPSEEYGNSLYELTRKRLGWDVARFMKASPPQPLPPAPGSEAKS